MVVLDNTTIRDDTLIIVNVALGIIVRHEHKEVLLSLRAPHVLEGNLWEFPGGKIKNDETSFEALCRELREEIGIIVNKAQSLPLILHHYETYSVKLHPWV